MSNCLTDTIGIIGCGSSTPASGIFINSLPGISLKSIDAIAEAEQADYVGLWSDVQENAYRSMMIDVEVELSKRYKLKRITSTVDLGRVIDTLTTTAADTEYRGLIFDLNSAYAETSEFKGSALASHYIQSISFYSPINQNGTSIVIADAVTGTTLTTLTRDITLGWNLISVDQKYTASKLAVGVDSTNINSVSLTVADNLTWTTSCSSVVEGFRWDISGSPVSGTTGTNSYGMSIVYGTRCSFESLICQNKDVFYLPYAYKCAIELTVRRQFSSRTSAWTLNQKEAEALRLYYETEYAKTLTQVCHTINLNTHDSCLDCDGTFTIVERIP